MKFEHIGVRVNNLEESKEFYTKVIGCKIMHVYERPAATLVFLDAYGITIELIYTETYKERSIGPVEHIAFRVNNLEEKIAELKSFGIELDSEPRISGTNKIAFFRGPNGERFEYMEKSAE